MMTDIGQAIEELRRVAREGAEYTVRDELGLAADALEEAMTWIGAPVTEKAEAEVLAKLGYEKPEPSELHKKLDEALAFHLSSAHRETVVGLVEKLVAEELAKAVKTESNQGVRFRAVQNGVVVGPERGGVSEALEDLKEFLGCPESPSTPKRGLIQFSEPGGSGIWTTYAKNLSYWDIVHSEGRTGD